MIEDFRYDKFLDRLIADGDCIVFNGSKNPQGYGSFQGAKGRRVSVHRLSYEIFVGPIAPGLVIDHICRNRACVRPDHLRQVTHQENILAGVGATAANAKKTHCPSGHEYTQENTHKTRHGRACKICRKEKKTAWDLKNKERVRKINKLKYELFKKASA